MGGAVKRLFRLSEGEPDLRTYIGGSDEELARRARREGVVPSEVRGS
jgi:hypothetical protein